MKGIESEAIIKIQEMQMDKAKNFMIDKYYRIENLAFFISRHFEMAKMIINLIENYQFYDKSDEVIEHYYNEIAKDFRITFGVDLFK